MILSNVVCSNSISRISYSQDQRPSDDDRGVLQHYLVSGRQGALGVQGQQVGHWEWILVLINCCLIYWLTLDTLLSTLVRYVGGGAVGVSEGLSPSKMSFTFTCNFFSLVFECLKFP